MIDKEQAIVDCLQECIDGLKNLTDQDPFSRGVMALSIAAVCETKIRIIRSQPNKIEGERS